MKQSRKIFVGMDVHKESIDITLAEQDGEIGRFGTVGGDRVSLLKAVRKLTSRGRALVFVYEAGPCGFWIYRELTALGYACVVVSPTLIPRRSGDHVKTDRRDSENLARLARADELTGIHVPDMRDEAIRALIEAAWAYRFPARVSRLIVTRQSGLPKVACDIAWKAQLRLCTKYRRLSARRVNPNKIVVALARELSGFVWAIGQCVKPH